MLKAIQPLHAGVNLLRQVGARRAQAQLMERAPDHGVGQRATHRLLHTAIGIAGEIFQARQQAPGNRAAQFDFDRAIAERFGGPIQHGLEGVFELADLRRHFGDSQWLHGDG